jgi:Ser/Thr protein kinase RdoA (MazF antagonist)
MGNNFLNQRHASYHTAEAVLRFLVKEETGQNIRHFEPITSGYANEVYRVDTDNNDSLIIRIGRFGTTNFPTEAWAMQQAREAEVPVPKVHSITQINIDENQLLDVMLIQQVLGRSIESVQEHLTTKELSHIYEQVGKVLSRLHQVRVAGFGALQPNGRGSFSDWYAFVQFTLEQRVSDIPYIVQAGLLESEAYTLLEITRELQLSSDTQPVLCHGDLSNEHIFVDDDLTVTGIIDFGQCQGGPPAIDTAVLLMFHPEIDLAWLKRGYYNKVHSDTLYRRQILLHQANIQMSYLAHDIREGNTDSRDIVLQSMRNLIREWQNQ